MTKTSTKGLIVGRTVPMTTTGRPSTLPHAVDYRSWWILLSMTPILTSTHPPHACTSSNHPTCAVPYMKTPTVQRWKIAQILQCRAYPGSSEWMVSVLRWCGFPGIYYTAVLPWKLLCGDLARVRCMRVSVVPIPPTSVPLLYLQTRWSETFRDKKKNCTWIQLRKDLASSLF